MLAGMLQSSGLPGLGGACLRIFVLGHFIGSGLYWWLQPRGFEFGSRAFLEHQVVSPAMFGVSAFAAAGTYLGVRYMAAAIGLLAGFWLAVGSVTTAVGSTLFAAAMVGVVAAAAVAFVRVLKPLQLEGHAGVLYAATPFGAGLGVLFLLSAWSPPSTSHPSAETQARAVPSLADSGSITQDGIELRTSGSHIVVRCKGREVLVWPLMEFDSVSRSGHWTIFDHSTARPVVSKTGTGEGRLWIKAVHERMDATVEAWIAQGRVHIRSETLLRQDIAAHLATSMSLSLPGRSRLSGTEWASDPSDETHDFVAWERGRLKLLRPKHREKGPFETRASLEAEDPLLETAFWKVRVLGWHAQASRAESPTAGWGVSQGAIERVGQHYLWSLACTSVGRGYSAVRTGKGRYVLEAILEPRE